jgi:hypothetical protein
METRVASLRLWHPEQMLSESADLSGWPPQLPIGLSSKAAEAGEGKGLGWLVHFIHGNFGAHPCGYHGNCYPRPELRQVGAARYPPGQQQQELGLGN